MSILFVSAASLPDQSANATRIVNLAKLFRCCGEEPILLGTRYEKQVILEGEYDGIKFFNVDASAYLSISKIKRKKYLEKLLLQTIYTLWNKYHFDKIVANSFAFQSISFLLNFAKEKHMAIMYNSVEWYQKDNISFEGLGGKVKLFYNRYGLIIQHAKLGNIIGISSLLTEYYKKKKCNVIRIPTIVDKERYVFVEQNHNNKLTIAYAGSPSRKDYIANAIKALLLLSSNERKQIELHIYGANEKQLINLGISTSMMDELSGVLHVHGRIPYAEVQGKIGSADFTILLRPNLRYANAGFPTKVGESMMCGTPVIANHTSDLNLYIRDEETGIVVLNESPEACAESFRKALKMSDQEKKRMRAAARTEAEIAFSYCSYQQQMEQFIKDLRKQ